MTSSTVPGWRWIRHDCHHMNVVTDAAASSVPRLAWKISSQSDGVLEEIDIFIWFFFMALVLELAEFFTFIEWKMTLVRPNMKWSKLSFYMVKHIFCWSQTLPNSIFTFPRSKLKSKKSACMHCGLSVSTFQEWKTGYSPSSLRGSQSEVWILFTLWVKRAPEIVFKLCWVCLTIQQATLIYLFVSLHKHPE